MFGTSNAIARREVAFVETNVPNWRELADNVRSGVEIVILDAGEDGIGAMSDWVAARSGYDAIHLISHGRSGALDLGKTILDWSTIGNHLGTLARIGRALNPGGDVLLYGCHVGSGSAGEAFLTAFADATGADVAASDDLTGPKSLGGNWTLEKKTGTIETGFVGNTEFSEIATILETVTFTAAELNSGSGNFNRVVGGQSFGFSGKDGYFFDNLHDQRVPYHGYLVSSDMGVGPDATSFTIAAPIGYTFDLGGFAYHTAVVDTVTVRVE
ncbi:DUF4347 domain-containing protein [Aureimonas phyllosphaerae]|uniref:DUF4347 domain-containing protein n=1 Tax=Aureimonas phyllosphaerae TaxID=1166078 RepID=A0A7W6FVI8_9HYPH|nr:DUF4347 domain-containing protein [Aureimonas phyllosphaerae]MBB3937334.1 hypothetical protein [Aureimonas phyllosphaerae]MBB3961341.1 hypothetical protein [Aureimonas phyllosphaerae]SFF42080.1 protein of unknown function [Aureimonas phyllosphaerae]